MEVLELDSLVLSLCGWLSSKLYFCEVHPDDSSLDNYNGQVAIVVG